MGDFEDKIGTSEMHFETTPKRQLRAEAVERLKKLDFLSDRNILNALVGEHSTTYYKGATKVFLIHMLTEDPILEKVENPDNRKPTNLEWMFEHERDFVADWVSMAKYCRYCAFWDDCDGSMGADDPKCIRGNREWLMSARMDDKKENN